MKMKTILFPSDFSSDANNALKYAIQFSVHAKSRLIVFYSIDIPESFPKKDYEKAILEIETYKKTILEYMVIAICKKYKLHQPENIVYEVKNGNSVVENILHIGQKYKAEMIIVGTHGLTGLKKVLFGSNTARLILRSSIPVLAIPNRFNYKKIKNIIDASDMTHLSTEVSSLLPIADAIEASIEILYFDCLDKGKEKEEQFNEMISKKHFKNVYFVSKSASIKKTIAEHLVNYIKKNKDSIIAIFSEEKSFLNFFSSRNMKEKIAFNLRKPLLSIKKSTMLK